MDKTTTWLVRAASLIVILFGIGYVSNPSGNKIKELTSSFKYFRSKTNLIGNKINELTSSFKDFRSKSNLKGIACAPTKEDLNKSDYDFFNGKVLNGFYWLFDQKSGVSYRYNVSRNYFYNYLDYIIVNQINKNSEVSKVTSANIENSIIYIEIVSFSHDEASTLSSIKLNISNREILGKINLKTLNYYGYSNNSYSLQGSCRYMKIPKNTKIFGAQEDLEGKPFGVKSGKFLKNLN